MLDIYRKLRPGEPPTVDASRTLLNNYYFNPKRYDLCEGWSLQDQQKALSRRRTVRERVVRRGHRVDDRIPRAFACRVRRPPIHPRRDSHRDHDDIDHFGNRRLRTVGELIQNQIRTGLSRMERVVRERMTTQDVEAITPQTLINIRPVVASLKEFFELRSCRSSWTRRTRLRA